MNRKSHILQAERVEFGYRTKRRVLCGVDLSARSGRLVCVLGPNGSGKTTLLRCLLGQLQPSGGAINLDGRAIGKFSIRELARMVAYVPQVAGSVFPFTAREIVMMGRYPHTNLLGVTTRDDLAVADQAMAMTETLEFAGRTLDELSGGEAQRVMIARALTQQPAVMLLDEPTSCLDIRHQIAIYRMMGRLAKQWHMAVVCVSHDVNLAGRFADELILLRQGQVLAAGPPVEVISRDILKRAYDVDVELIDSPDGQAPIVRVQ